MARIAVFHPDLTLLGGGEAVCMNVLEALQHEHEITLVTMATPGFETLNEYYGTDVTNVAVEQYGAVGHGLRLLGRLVTKVTGKRLIRLQSAVLKRLVDAGDFDLVGSTFDEFSFTTPAVQYIHYPSAAVERESELLEIYDRLCEWIQGYDSDSIAESTIVTNSEWTADRVEDVYDVRPTVIYPPVAVEEFDPVPWEERERGFVTIGRIEPSKRILRMIRIVSRLREHGYDVHLHIIGPTTFDDYGEQVRKAASQRDFIHLEGELPRQELVELICTHKFGLHGKENEHFGITVAELVAGGAIPFVPDSGGQREIVGHSSSLCYSDEDAAVQKIRAMLDDEDKEGTVRSMLPDMSANYGQSRFQNEIRRLTDQVVTGIHEHR